MWKDSNLIEEDNPDLSITKQCELLSISRSRYYYKSVAHDNSELQEYINQEYTIHPFYGYRKIAVSLQRKNINVTRKQVRTEMHKMGLQAIYPKPKLSIPNKENKKFPYLLRNMKINKNNKVWSTDITYIKLKGGFVYLVAIIDLFSRKILSWRLSNTLCVDFCIECLNEALMIYHKPKIFNTDQGSQFTSNIWIDILEKKGIKISMDRKGRALDNIFIERFWRSYKYEDLYIKEYKSMAELKGGVKEYINFYNDERVHQSLEYQTPDEIYYSKK